MHWFHVGSRSLRPALCAAVAMAMVGCLSPVHVRSARTLQPGEYEVAGHVSGARALLGAVDWYNGTQDLTKKGATAANYVNPLEVVARRGIVPNVDAGLRLGIGSALLGAEGTWRFMERDFGSSGRLHLATGAQISQSLLDQIHSGRAVVPVLATWDWLPFSLTLAGHVGYRWVSQPAMSPTSLPEAIKDVRWTMGENGLTAGGGLLFDWHDDTTTLGIAFEFDHWAGAIGAAGRELSDYGVNVLQLSLVGGFRFGLEEAEAERTRDAIDGLSK
ncbi:MAG: hypothetical protein HY902_18265 [Deltaproteobacteria bacterium]|nr:hypothetical protein [Deltaproteobacteria bacterium]